MTSKKKIISNRKNAKKSTGPVTPEGKEIASRNSLRHGILSDEVYISTGHEITRAEDFAELKADLFCEFQPEGTIEALLVDRLVATFWRLKRLHIAETGYILKQIESRHMQSAIDGLHEHSTARNDRENGFFRNMRTSIGCHHLALGWRSIYESIKENGLPLSKGMTDALYFEFGGNSGYFKTEYIYRFNWIFENNGGTKPLTEEDKKLFTEEALRISKELWKWFERTEELIEWDEKDVRKADIRSKMIPPLGDLDKFQRYDAHLHRILMQTLHELQRIQSARMGRPMPLAGALDVTLNTDNT